MACEDEALTATNITGKEKKGRKKIQKDDLNWNWDGSRVYTMQALIQLVSICKDVLWTDRTPETELINTFTKTAFKFLENPAVVKDQESKQNLFELIGTTVENFRQAFAATTSILHLLSHFEHLVEPLAALVNVLVTKFKGQAVINELLREIGRNDPRELARDTNGTRNMAGFLQELGDRIPSAILKSGGISVLLPHLNGESYPLRNAILSLLTSIICEMVRQDDLSESGKKTRDQFQDILEDRFHDVSAYVRTRVLQLWLKMAAVEISKESESGSVRSAIPRDRHATIVRLTAGRLLDKSSLVRKEALRLITVLLARNPYGPNISISLWNSDLKKAATELGSVAEGILKKLEAKSEEGCQDTATAKSKSAPGKKMKKDETDALG